MEKSVEQLRKDYNSNLNNRKLRDLFKRKSYMEILRKNNDENTHSAFIEWLLEGKGFSVDPDDSPLMTFLDLLIAKDDSGKINEGLRKSILARQVKIEIDIKSSSVEKVIKDVSSIKSNDRLDIYFLCKVIRKNAPSSPTKSKKTEFNDQLEIIIENKISSLEGNPKDFNSDDEYKTQYQTQRYYYAFDKGRGRIENSEKIFVYLTKRGAQGPKCKEHFIHITYQDIYESVLLPISNLELNNVTKVFIDEYIKTITLPSIDTKKQRNYLAFTAEEVEMLQHYLEDNRELLIRAAEAKEKENNNDLLMDFWDSNEVIIQAIREAGISDIDEVILNTLKSSESQRDTTKYFYVVEKERKEPKNQPCNVDKKRRGNGKGATVLAVVHELINKGKQLTDLQPISYVDSKNQKQKELTYIKTEDEWKDSKNSGNKDEEFKKRNFTDKDEPLTINGITYYVSNQWGVGDEFNAFIQYINEMKDIEIFAFTTEDK